MATVLLPRSLLALFPGVEKRNELAGGTVGDLITALDASVPGMRDRLVEAGPRLRPHINVFVDGEPANLATTVAPGSTVTVPGSKPGYTAASRTSARSTRVGSATVGARVKDSAFQGPSKHSGPSLGSSPRPRRARCRSCDAPPCSRHPSGWR